MKRYLKYIVGGVLATLLLSCTDSVKGPAADYHIIPLPQQIEETGISSFTLSPTTRIGYPVGNEKVKQLAEFLSGYIREITGFQPETTEGLISSNGINLLLDDTSDDSSEAYQLEVNDKTVVITGKSEAGLFYGIQTLRKSLPEGVEKKIHLPSVSIKDYPRFQYRGMHLDVGRHFFSTDFIKRYIDILALHNFNTFHWHLTEDQGWRIEIKKYPRLTEIGSQRKESLLNDGSGQFDGIPYGGFYTQEEVREIVRYAADRYITVIPEIDLPGHITSALAAYPELGCTGGPYEVTTTYGVHKEVLCVGNEQSLRFAEDVLSEIIDLFPSHYIHVGGDECPRDRWNKCPKCQQLIHKMGWKDSEEHKAEDKLQSYFMTRIEEFVNGRGRQIIGWDEILEGGLAPNATVMSWRGTENGIKAAQQHHDVIMTPAGFLYFSSRQLLELGGNRGIRRIYDFEPVPDSLPIDVQKHIIGIQGCLWSERIETPERAEYLILPRLAALSEIAWSASEQHHFAAFMDRLYHMINLYDREEYTYSKHAFQITESFEPDTVCEALTVSLSTIGNRPIHYTLDSSEPDIHSPVYTTPISVDKDALLQARVIFDGDTSELFRENIKVNKATFKPIRLLYPSHPNYTFGGETTLTDGLRGNNNYNTGRWLGFLTDMDLIIDLREIMPVTTVSFTANISKGAAIMGPTGFDVLLSDNGNDFRKVASESYPIMGKDDKDGIYPYSLDFSETQARYVRIIVRVTPELPVWHMWPGSAAFLFVDEVCVE